MRRANARQCRYGCCLNPYYTGSYSMSLFVLWELKLMMRLNPYYTGSYSMRPDSDAMTAYVVVVLILIILEVTL